MVAFSLGRDGFQAVKSAKAVKAGRCENSGCGQEIADTPLGTVSPRLNYGVPRYSCLRFRHVHNEKGLAKFDGGVFPSQSGFHHQSDAEASSKNSHTSQNSK